MRGSWVGTLCSWRHCPLESGGTFPLQGDATQPPRLTPRMAEVATAHPLLPDNSRETSTQKRQKREDKEGAHDRKTCPTPPPARAGSKAGLRGALACWHSHSGLRAVTRVCSSQTRNLSLSFSELLVATCSVQSLERPGKPNSSRHATSPGGLHHRSRWTCHSFAGTRELCAASLESGTPACSFLSICAC